MATTGKVKGNDSRKEVKVAVFTAHQIKREVVTLYFAGGRVKKYQGRWAIPTSEFSTESCISEELIVFILKIKVTNAAIKGQNTKFYTN